MLRIECTERFSEFLEYDFVEGTSNTDFIFLTSFVSDKMERQFERLRLNGNAVQIVPLTDDPLPSYADPVQPAASNEESLNPEHDESETKGA
jgi:hypothetical protein